MYDHNCALLLLGHGSTLNADSSAPTYQHAEEIRRRGLFAEVHVGFWKEEPNFRQALRQTLCQRIYVVPNFISSGYFTEQVIPRELGLTGPVTHRDGQEIFYCPPVGLHPSMTEALLRRAAEVTASSVEKIAEPAKTACLFICGHGTSLNDNSTKIIHEQVAAIRQRGLYADCQGVLMEQSPYVRDWRTLTDCPDVIVVPFFISDGLHSYEDIPVLLGLTHNIKEQGFTNPHRENGRRLWYATAIGTDAFIADVILAQVESVQPKITQHEPSRPVSIHEKLARFLLDNPGPWTIGELSIQAEGDVFILQHQADLGNERGNLKSLATEADWRDAIRVNRAGHFRPLRAATDLPSGWVYVAPDLQHLQRALDYFYPAALANWVLQREENLPVTPWPETAARQTGRFRIVREIDEAALRELVADHCESGCLKKRLWSSGEITGASSTDRSEIPLLCPEACNYLVGKAREKLKGSGED